MQEINNNTAQNRMDRLGQMLKDSPGDCFLLHALGLEHLKIGQQHEAIGCFKQVISNDENYVGTYYHLAKTYENLGQIAEAMGIYEKGILIAGKLKDQHAMNELRMALDEITDD